VDGRFDGFDELVTCRAVARAVKVCQDLEGRIK